MANSSLPFSSSGHNQIQSGYSSLEEKGKAIAGDSMQEHSGTEDWGDIDSFCMEHGVFQQNSVEEIIVTPQTQSQQEIQHQQLPSDLNIRILSADQGVQEMTKIKNSRTGNFLRRTKELTGRFLVGHSSQFKGFGPMDVRNINSQPCAGIQKLSAEKIMRLAGERFIEFSSQKFININMLVHPYGSTLSYLTVNMIDMLMCQLD